MTIKEFAEKLKTDLQKELEKSTEQQKLAFSVDDESVGFKWFGKMLAYKSIIAKIEKLVEKSEQERTQFEKWNV